MQQVRPCVSIFSDWEKWNARRLHGSSPKPDLLSESLVPVMHLLMIPYSELIIRRMRQRELHKKLPRLARVYSDYRILTNANLAWAGCGFGVLVFSLLADYGIKRAEKHVEKATSWDDRKETDGDSVGALVEVQQRPLWIFSSLAEDKEEDNNY